MNISKSVHSKSSRRYNCYSYIIQRKQLLYDLLLIESYRYVKGKACSEISNGKLKRVTQLCGPFQVSSNLPTLKEG